MFPAATQGDLTQVPIIHSAPASELKSFDETNIIPLSVDCPALPSACILGSWEVWINDFFVLYGLFNLKLFKTYLAILDEVQVELHFSPQAVQTV